MIYRHSSTFRTNLSEGGLTRFDMSDMIRRAAPRHRSHSLVRPVSQTDSMHSHPNKNLSGREKSKYEGEKCSIARLAIVRRK